MKENNTQVVINVDDYRILAKKKLSADIFDYIDCGAGDQITERKNREAFNQISLKPLCLRDVSRVDSSLVLLGKRIANPFLIGPTAFHKLMNEGGEVCTAKAAQKNSIPMVVSSMSNFSLEEIADSSGHDNLWLQIYVFKNREITKNLILRAENSNYKALLITVGSPQIGKRDKVLRNQFSLPKELTIGNFEKQHAEVNQFSIQSFVNSELDPSLTWEDIKWVQKNTKLPVILKGIMNVLDAKKACQIGVEGIVVSNHGGRQLDTTEATIKVLPHIVDSVSERIVVLLDSGIRRGTDVFKALALGAQAVLLGRTILFGLAVRGEEGVTNVLNILSDELEMTMKLSGCCTLEEINRYSQNILAWK